MSDKAKFIEALERDFDNREVLLADVPEIRMGNPVKKNLVTMMESTLAWAKESDTTTADFGTVDYQIMPLLRRIYPSEVAFDLVTVQPMNMPTGKVFWVNDVFGDAQAGGSPDAITEDSRMDSYKSYTYADSTEGGTIKRVSQTLTSATISASQKKLKGVWTIESEQDARAYLGLNLENEHTRIIAEEFRREQGYYILVKMLAGASAGNVNWNVNTTSTLPSEIRAHAERIWEAIVSANNLVFAAIYRNINFIIGGTTSIGRLEKIENFKLIRSAGNNPYQVGRQLVGTIDTLVGNTIRVYKDPWFPETNKLLVGYKGDSWFEAGCFWAPYVPLFFTPSWVDPDTLTKKKGAMTRYGVRSDTSSIILNGDYYATITFTTS